MGPAYGVMAGDALRVMPRLVGASLRVGRARAFGDSAARERQLTSAAFLEDQLGVGPGRIEGAHIEEVHSGTATRSRLHVRYAGRPDPPPGPRSLFVKSRPPDFGSALFGALFELGGNEVRFYRHLRPEVPVPAPGVAWCDGDSVDYVMLLEDLTDQGCDFRTLASDCTLEEATAVVTTLARLHAAFWQSPRFADDLAWVKRLETNRDAPLLDLVRRLSVPISVRKFGHVMPERLREFLPELLEVYPRLEQHWAEEPRTLIHGDAHLGNMYFQDGRAGLLDWQVCQLGQGMRDVSYFLINSVGTELRRAHQQELVDHYLATLAGQGVALDRDTAWRQYRLQSVYAWIASVVTAPSNFQPEEIVVAGMARASRALVDLEAIELIREL